MKKIKYQAVCCVCNYRSDLVSPKLYEPWSVQAAYTMAYIIAETHYKKTEHTTEVELWKEVA
jgi:hypothetical protein